MFELARWGRWAFASLSTVFYAVLFLYLLS
jgi:hypothetical protein